MEGFNLNITDKEFIISLIPQKPPFVMVDKLFHFEEKRITSGLKVESDNIFVFEGNFTEPGLIENMAQTLALHSGYKFFLRNESPPLGFIGAIKKAEIFKLPKLGDELFTTVEIIHDIMGMTLITAQITCDGNSMAAGEMKTILMVQ